MFSVQFTLKGWDHTLKSHYCLSEPLSGTVCTKGELGPFSLGSPLGLVWVLVWFKGSDFRQRQNNTTHQFFQNNFGAIMYSRACHYFCVSQSSPATHTCPANYWCHQRLKNLCRLIYILNKCRPQYKLHSQFQGSWTLSISNFYANKAVSH